jgi:hypothetical protein
MELSECATTGAIRPVWRIFLIFAVSPLISVPASSPVAAVPPQKCQDDIGGGRARKTLPANEDLLLREFPTQSTTPRGRPTCGSAP